MVKKSIKVLKILHDLRAARNDKKDQLVVCAQIQTSKAVLLKSRKKKCIYVASIALLSIWVRRYHLV